MIQQETLPRKKVHYTKNGIHFYVNPYSGGKFVTNDEGARIIDLMDQEQDEEKLVQLIADELDINPYEVAARLVTFMDSLHKHRMLAETDEYNDDSPIPAFGFLEVTRKCDTHCRLCYVDSGQEYPDALTQEEIFQVIDQMAELGVQNIALTGGDPLTRKDLLEILDYIHTNNNLKPAISTSLLSLKEELAQKLSDTGAAVQVSLDGSNAEINDWNRGEGSFEKTMKGIELLQKYQVPFRFAFVINKKNMHDVENMVALGIDLGAKEVAFGKVKIAGRAAHQNGQIVPTPEELTTVYHKLYRAEVDTRNIELQVRCKHNQGLRAGLENRVGCLPCGAGRTFVHVAYNGEVIPCSLFTGCREFQVGNVRNDHLTDLWEQASIYKYFRETKAEDIEVCHSCSAKLLCGGGCRADAYNTSGDINGFCSDCQDLVTYYNWILDRACRPEYVTAF